MTIGRRLLSALRLWAGLACVLAILAGCKAVNVRDDLLDRPCRRR